jgi:hypothetical protein
MTINDEQLEAEMAQGLHEHVGFVVSRTTLAHLVFAAQLALGNELPPGSVEVYRAFVRDAVRIGGFPVQTRRLIQQRNQTT